MWVVKSGKFCYQWILWLKRTGRGKFQANRTTGWPANIWSKSTRSVRFRNIRNHHLFQNDFIYIIQWVYVFCITFKIMVLDFLISLWTSWLWPYVCRSTSRSIGLKFTAPGSFKSKNPLITKFFQFDHPYWKKFVILIFDLYNEKLKNLRSGSNIYDDIHIIQIVSASSTSSA